MTTKDNPTQNQPNTEGAWQSLLHARRTLKAAKPAERGERTRRFAVAITLLEQVIAYFDTMVRRELGD